MTHRALPEIVLIEDSIDDCVATTRALRSAGFEGELQWRETGEEALQLLLGAEEGEPKRCRPSLVLLDLNLPGMPGTEVLRRIRRHPVLQPIPVVVFSTSASPDDVQACYREGANSYIQKPVSRKALYHAIEMLLEYWSNVVLLPESRDP